VLPDLKDNFFLALRATVQLTATGDEEAGVERDKETGLLSSTSFSEMAVERLRASAESGEAAGTDLGQPARVPTSSTKPCRPKNVRFLRNTVARPCGRIPSTANSAGEIGDGKFGIVTAAASMSPRWKKPWRRHQGVRSHRQGHRGPGRHGAGPTPRDFGRGLTKGLVYTINHFREQSATNSMSGYCRQYE